ncbi:MAG TPA: iron uptake system protein EfeO [Solirubrobacterales bacterium]|nr:iron uptake system protein EfeO [Solirubrobacterales bacterium]
MTSLNPTRATFCGLLVAGTLTLAACGDDDESTSEAASSSSTTEATAEIEPVLLDEAVAEYDAYVEQETGDFVVATEDFLAPVEAGDVDGAKAAYPGARVHFERIEPVAGAFGDLDPDIDGREGDIPPQDWGGYHRIEKALWIDESTEGLEKTIKELRNDVANLNDIAIKAEFDPAEIAQGSVDLLAEVSASKITGEEERYSHTDLWDFEANVAGAEAGFEALKPALEQADPELADEIEMEFAAMYELLDQHREGDGFVLYDTLSEEQTQELAQQIDTLGEPLSQIPSLVG